MHQKKIDEHNQKTFNIGQSEQNTNLKGSSVKKVPIISAKSENKKRLLEDKLKDVEDSKSSSLKISLGNL